MRIESVKMQWSNLRMLFSMLFSIIAMFLCIGLELGEFMIGTVPLLTYYWTLLFPYKFIKE